MSAIQPSYRAALRVRDFRLLVIAFTQSAAGDWAYNVALVVYVYQHTHSAAWVSAATLGRMVPAFLTSTYGGVIAERFERVRVMVSADLIRFVLMSGIAVLMASGAPAWSAIAVAAVSSAVATVYQPSTAAMIPQILGEECLAAGNALTEVINNVAIIAGPAIGAIVLALGKPWVVLALDAATFLVSAWLVWQVETRSTPTDVTEDGNALRQMAVGIRAITSSTTAMVLVGFTIVTTSLYGVDTVLFVFLSKDKLGTGAEGYGYLLVALGVGGVIAAAFVNKLAALPRLSVVLAVGMVAYAAPTALLVLVHAPAAAAVIEVVRGIATLIVDVLAMTALQRSLAPELISRVFGAMWALVLGGLIAGALITPFVLSGAGLDTTLLLDGLLVPVAVALVYPKLASLDRIASTTAEILAPRVRVLEQLDIFAAASRPVLERLAASLEEAVFEPGTTIVREGETADALYVLTSGRVEVTAAAGTGGNEHIRFMTGPSYVGEIGLLESVPRTATVTAVEPTAAWRLDGDTFLAALTETSLSASFVSGMSRRIKRTHPERDVTLPTQRLETSEAEPAV